MTDITCTYGGDREHTLIAYLYDDIDPAERAAFDAHLPGCERCRRDLAALGGVRRQLAAWAPPEPHLTSHHSQSPINPQSAIRNPHWWEHVPVWAQVAAALLFLGVSAGIANLDVRYDANGLSMRTGWSRPAPAAQTMAVPADVASRTELTALEQQLRGEIRAVQTPAQPQRAAANDADVNRRLRALIDESEKRQQRELALRIAQISSDVNAQRQVDLSKIDRNLGLFQNQTGVEILKQREMVNYLMRVSQRQ